MKFRLGCTGTWLEMPLNYFIAVEGCEAEQKVKQAAFLFTKISKNKQRIIWQYFTLFDNRFEQFCS